MPAPLPGPVLVTTVACIGMLSGSGLWYVYPSHQVVAFSKVRNLYHKLNSKDGNRSTEELHKALDIDGDGSVTPEDLQHLAEHSQGKARHHVVPMFVMFNCLLGVVAFAAFLIIHRPKKPPNHLGKLEITHIELSDVLDTKTGQRLEATGHAVHVDALVGASKMSVQLQKNENHDDWIQTRTGSMCWDVDLKDDRLGKLSVFGWMCPENSSQVAQPLGHAVLKIADVFGAHWDEEFTAKVPLMVDSKKADESGSVTVSGTFRPAVVGPKKQTVAAKGKDTVSAKKMK
eukprot:TRINITY_DN31536_c0_g1_i2.p1 TRINITY_DN31536_c0_g1~~TRINITY_DN31536_c0_g1_i2.p1  ORF type:complete len:300 (+),score=54.87 TRINITY_DN31536_c0_g1_i2:41-901(+)